MADHIHLLFRGDKLPSIRDDFVDEFTRNNLIATTIPILEFKYKNLEKLADLLSESSELNSTNGVIITSPRVVEAINAALKISNLRDSMSIHFDPELIFVVGKKSAQECESKLGLKCNASSAQTGNSRTLIDYIKTVCAGHQPSGATINLLYPKSSLADSVIEDTLASEGKIRLKPIVVYETGMIDNLADIAIQKLSCLQEYRSNLTIPTKLILNMIFFSPSGVDSYLRIGQDLFDKLKTCFPNSDIEFRYSSIGNTTEAALLSNNMQVYCVSKKPNPESLVECILKASTNKNCEQ